jgi:hypothetical protein
MPTKIPQLVNSILPSSSKSSLDGAAMRLVPINKKVRKKGLCLFSQLNLQMEYLVSISAIFGAGANMFISATF